MADNTQAIAEIEEILRAGVKTFVNDGTTVTHDFAELRKSLRELKATDDTLGNQRPKAVSVDLGGF